MDSVFDLFFAAAAIGVLDAAGTDVAPEVSPLEVMQTTTCARNGSESCFGYVHLQDGEDWPFYFNVFRNHLLAFGDRTPVLS